MRVITLPRRETEAVAERAIGSITNSIPSARDAGKIVAGTVLRRPGPENEPNTGPRLSVCPGQAGQNARSRKRGRVGDPMRRKIAEKK